MYAFGQHATRFCFRSCLPNHDFAFPAPATDITIRDSKTLTLKMATALFAETLENQHYTQFIPQRHYEAPHRGIFSGFPFLPAPHHSRSALKVKSDSTVIQCLLNLV
jgi:hypothetical protein